MRWASAPSSCWSRGSVRRSPWWRRPRCPRTRHSWRTSSRWEIIRLHDERIYSEKRARILSPMSKRVQIDLELPGLNIRAKWLFVRTMNQEMLVRVLLMLYSYCFIMLLQTIFHPTALRWEEYCKEKNLKKILQKCKSKTDAHFNHFNNSSRISPWSSSWRTTPSSTTTPSRPRSTRPPARGTAPESETSSPRKSRTKNKTLWKNRHMLTQECEEWDASKDTVITKKISWLKKQDSW